MDLIGPFQLWLLRTLNVHATLEFHYAPRVLQVAAEGDITDNSSVHWPADRLVVELENFTLDAVVPEILKAQKYVIFDLIRRVEGVAPSDFPLPEMRAAYI
ncbi:hypothetical protein WAI453_000070 [Rhynchosporium graminicola]